MKRLPKWRLWFFRKFNEPRYFRYVEACRYQTLKFNDRVMRIFAKAATETIDILMGPYGL